MVLEELVPIIPVHFFAISADCLYHKGKKEQHLPKSHLLPDLSALHGQSQFADVSLGWSEKGVFATVKVHRPLVETAFPNLGEGDSVELFFDTRDVKTSGFTTRFCHHFYFLPEPVETDGSNQAGEITRFRTEDVHELCDPELLFTEVQKGRGNYQLQIFIPAECLHGFDPELFDRMGFTYRINQFRGVPQQFSVSSEDYPIEQQPSLWASLKLIK